MSYFLREFLSTFECEYRLKDDCFVCVCIFFKGLPLIFRQDNAKIDAAGQFEEHELARSLSPLLFCYADKEQPNL